MEEIWKDVKDYEGIYQVSNLGNVKSLDRVDSFGRKRKGKLLKLNNGNKGYKIVTLLNNNNQKTMRVHRLVATAFIPNPNKYPIVNHKDENITNNNVENLEWCTNKYNTNYGSCPQKHSEIARNMWKEKLWHC